MFMSFYVTLSVQFLMAYHNSRSFLLFNYPNFFNKQLILSSPKIYRTCSSV